MKHQHKHQTRHVSVPDTEHTFTPLIKSVGDEELVSHQIE